MVMKIRLTELRRMVRGIILETYESDDEFYDDTVLPGEEADEELLAEPDLTDQEDRDAYIANKQKKRGTKVKLQSQNEIDNALGDESCTVSGGAIAGHMAGAWGPPQKPKKLKPKNAMGRKKRR
jgi:hypothetical protein